MAYLVLSHQHERGLKGAGRCYSEGVPSSDELSRLLLELDRPSFESLSMILACYHSGISVQTYDGPMYTL